MACVVPVYRPRDASRIVLHQVIRAHLETFLNAVTEARRRGGPAAVRGARVSGVSPVRRVTYETDDDRGLALSEVSLDGLQADKFRASSNVIHGVSTV